MDVHQRITVTAVILVLLSFLGYLLLGSPGTVTTDALGDAPTAEKYEDMKWVDHLRQGDRVAFVRPNEIDQATKKRAVVAGVADPAIKNLVRRHELERLDRDIRFRVGKAAVLQSSADYGSIAVAAEEAKLLERIAMLEECRHMVTEGTHVILKSISGVPLRVPNGKAIFGSSIAIPGGKEVWSYYVLTPEKNPRYFDVLEFKREVLKELGRRNVEAFNALDDEERRSRIALKDEAKRKRKSLGRPEYLIWVRKNVALFPPGGRVRRGSFTIEPQKR